MTLREQLLLEAMRCAVRGEQVRWQGRCAPEEWDGLFDLAYAHHVQPLLLEAVYNCPDYLVLSEEQRRQRKRLVMARCFGQIQREAEFLQLYGEMRAAGFSPLVVKGVVCRQLYPKPSLRPSSDEDLLVPAEEFIQAAAFLERLGLKQHGPAKDPAIEFELGYAKESGLLIELHQSLFAPGSPASAPFNEPFSNAHAHSVEITVEGTALKTMSPHNHMLYLLLHAYKHFIFSGFGVRQLCDILLWAERYGTEIDWEDLLKQCERLRCHRFTAAVFQIGRDHLGFEPKRACIPESLLLMELPTEAVLEDLLMGGAYGSATMSRKHSATITANAVEADRTGKKRSLLNTIFPSYQEMAGNRPYLNRYPFLLPVAWCGRILKYGRELLMSEGDNAVSESLRIGETRTELLRQLDIIETGKKL